MAILPPDPVYVLRGDMGPVHSLDFRISPYVEHLYAGAETGNIHIWDLKVFKNFKFYFFCILLVLIINFFQRHREICKLDAIKKQCLALHTLDDEYLIVQRKDGCLDIWNADGSNWILDKTIDTNYCGFCRYLFLNQ